MVCFTRATAALLARASLQYVLSHRTGLQCNYNLHCQRVGQAARPLPVVSATEAVTEAPCSAK